MTTYEEWRVTGEPGRGYSAYDITWSSQRYTDAEARARACQREIIAMYMPWTDGPHLHKRTVTVTDWEAIEP